MYIRIDLRRLPIDDMTGDGYAEASDHACRVTIERIKAAAGPSFIVTLRQDRIERKEAHEHD